MYTFFIALFCLIAGYFTYSKVVDKLFGSDDSIKTPALRLEDGVDYVPMPEWKIFLIQFLNIAGLGPIYGAIAGALWGPACFFWIVLGSVFAGGVHDYFSGMLSVRHDGKSISEVVGIYLGNGFKQFMRVFSVILLILVGVVFVKGPAVLLAFITKGSFANVQFWIYIVFAYYILATLLPIDKLIGNLYPIFGVCLAIMAVGITGGILFEGYHMPEMVLANLHPKNLPMWPLMCITIACGAISGFHSTQSPLMARCITSEKQGRRVFYGAMIAEGVLALIWAACSIAFFGGTEGLGKVVLDSTKGAGYVVTTMSITLLGVVGGALAIIGAVVCPITSGDTAFRSARLTIADFLNLKQDSIKSRLLISIPLFVVGFILTRIDFNVIWRYFAWANQTLAMLVLWSASVYMVSNKKNHWITTVPAVFMTAVTVTYILIAPEGFKLSSSISYPIGIIAAAVTFILFMMYGSKQKTKFNTNAAAK